MAEWTYRGREYTTAKTDWNSFSADDIPEKAVKRGDEPCDRGLVLVYHPKWDKCFWLILLGFHGNGSRMKAFIEDVYSGSTNACWVEARSLELVMYK